jgi:hypothetical protein
MLFLLIESIDVRHIGGFGVAHFVRCPILEGVIGMLTHLVLDDSRRTLFFRKTLPCKQAYTNKQAKKDRAN